MVLLGLGDFYNGHISQLEKKSDKGKDLGDEIADVMFVLICLANQTGIDLEESMRKNLEKKTKRDHSRHKENPKLNSNKKN